MKQYKDLSKKKQMLFVEIETVFFNHGTYADLGIHDFVEVLGVLICKYKKKEKKVN